MKARIKRAFLLFATPTILTISAFSQSSDGVVAWWKFDEGSGNIATDSVTGRNDTILAPRDVPEIGPGFSTQSVRAAV